MADSHLFGDYFPDETDQKKDDAPTSGLTRVYIRPGESHLFGSYFPEDVPNERVQAGFSAVSPPQPPISGFTKEQSDELNRRQATPAGENPRRFSDIRNLPRDLAREDIDRTNAIPDAIVQHYMGAKTMFESGLSDLMQGKILPNTTSTDPTKWEGGGALKTAGGIIGMPGSLLSGPTQELVQNPLTNITGNPDFGEKAALLTPFKGAGAIGDATKAVANNNAVDQIVKLIGPKNVPAAIDLMKSNPELRAADTSETLRGTTAGLAADPSNPTAMQHLIQSAQDSTASRPAAVRQAYTDTLGVRPEALKVLDTIKQNAQKVGDEQINPAIKGAGPVDLTPVIAGIDSKLKPGVRGVVDPDIKMELSPLQKELVDIRGKLTDENGSQFFDAQKIHEVQAELRRRAEDLSSSATGSDRSLGRELYKVRDSIVGAVDDASGGKYRPALTNYKGAMDIEDAFDRGLSVRRNREGIKGITEDSPEALDRWMKTASPEELAAHKLGVLEAYGHKMDSMKNAALAGRDIPATDFNFAKMKSVFGEDKATDLQRQMEDVRRKAETDALWTKNSKTGLVQAGQNALKVRSMSDLKPIGASSIIGGLAGHALGGSSGAATAMAAVGAGHAALHKLMQVSELSRNSEIARLSGALGPERADLIGRLAAHPAVISQLNKISNGKIP
jgi:hypothetical protein